MDLGHIQQLFHRILDDMEMAIYTYNHSTFESLGIGLITNEIVLTNLLEKNPYSYDTDL